MKKIILSNRISTIENTLDEVMEILREYGVIAELVSCKDEGMFNVDGCEQTYDVYTAKIEIKDEGNYFEFAAEKLTHILDAFILLEDENGEWYLEEYLNSVFC